MFKMFEVIFEVTKEIYETEDSLRAQHEEVRTLLFQQKLNYITWIAKVRGKPRISKKTPEFYDIRRPTLQMILLFFLVDFSPVNAELTLAHRSTVVLSFRCAGSRSLESNSQATALVVLSCTANVICTVLLNKVALKHLQYLGHKHPNVKERQQLSAVVSTLHRFLKVTYCLP